MADKTKQRVDGEAPKKRTCGTMKVHQRLLRDDARYLRNRVISENHQRDAQRRRASGRVGITRIPVIVHVVYFTEDQNLSDEQISSQIAVLNLDFRKQNADRSVVPAAFKPHAADARIEFVLEEVRRVKTTVESFSDDDGIKFAASGGSDAWPADKYLNIWTAPSLNAGGDALLGYAQFPGGDPATDGVVILHSAFGTRGTAQAPFNLGRTTTHEVGHWLNLRHIWGDDGNGCSGSDFVADTPNQAGPNVGTPSFPRISCANSPHGDMFMDFMDYVDDRAMVMFTRGQVTRMHTCLDADRKTIGESAPIEAHAIEQVSVAGEAVGHSILSFLADHGVITAPWLDRGVGGGSFKFVDDVKIPRHDKPPGSDLIGVIGGPLGNAIPFVLSTPHHSMAWTQARTVTPSTLDLETSQELEQLEAQLRVFAQADVDGALGDDGRAHALALFGRYQELLADGKQLRGG